MTSTALDLAQCASEPIRVPGAIQPHGWLVALDARDGTLAACSDNWAALLGVPREAVPTALGAALRDRPWPLGELVEGRPPVSMGTLELAGRRLHLAAHRLGARITLEFEPDAPDPGPRAPIYTLVRELVPRMQQTDSVDSLCRLVAVEMKRLTGFGRCLVYRFDAEGHGEVLAEALDPGYESYAGHRFPASDIPPQARELYRLNHIRLIPDARYTPVPVRTVGGTDPGPLLDMSQASLRSVSPVHLEYMRNMGTLASMSVSIIVAGELWGLVSCHDHAPRHLPYPIRAACEHLGQLLSLQIEAKEENERVSHELALRRRTLSMVAQLADSDASLQRLVGEQDLLLQMGRASGAAVILNERCWCTGETPGPEAVGRLAEWLAARIDTSFHTDRLAELEPQLADLLPSAAGLQAISISSLHRHYIVWFRRELVQTIDWAGDPRKEAQPASDGRLHPRRSFATWREQVRGRSLPWSAAEVNAALELRQALIGIVLRRAEEMAEVATELGRVNKELEAFSYTVSHDLRAPMRHIAGFVDLVRDIEGRGLSERSQRYLSHVKEASAHAGQLVDALLDFSRMGRSALKRTVIDTQQMVEGLIAEQAGSLRDARVEWTVERPLPPLWGDAVLIQAAVRNLLSNAVKYSRGREVARIRVRGLSGPEGSGLEVSDNGVGFQMKYVGKLFGVFQRLHQPEEFEGTGIGLATVRRVVERHGGTVSAWGEPDRGARFGFTLPARPPGSENAEPTAKTHDA